MKYKNMSYRDVQKEVFLLEHGFYDEDVVKYFTDIKHPIDVLGDTIDSVQLQDGRISFRFRAGVTMMYNPTQDWINILRKEYFRNKYDVKK